MEEHPNDHLTPFSAGKFPLFLHRAFWTTPLPGEKSPNSACFPGSAPIRLRFRPKTRLRVSRQHAGCSGNTYCAG